MKKYYEVTASMTFSKTVLVPIDTVLNENEAVELVEKLVDNFDIELLNAESEYDFSSSGVVKMKEEEASYFYDIYSGDKKEEARSSLLKKVKSLKRTNPYDKYTLDEIDWETFEFTQENVKYLYETLSYGAVCDILKIASHYNMDSEVDYEKLVDELYDEQEK